jgi:NhaP-type Na+/H+ or K+/H+ antiporter
MYYELAALATLFFLYSVIAGRIERSVLSGPMVFVILGFIMGPLVLGWIGGDVSNKELRVIADLSLALILFVDAATSDLSALRRKIHIPARMLLIGLPGAIILGFCLALFIFDELSLFEAAILGTMLAATDAALGKPVITNKSVPTRIRESLNAESGLNDGLCVPVLFAFIALAGGESTEGGGVGLTLNFLVRELGIGLVVGLIVASVGSYILKLCWIKGWITKIWLHIAVVALALAAFAIAQSLHGSGYIAAFSGGLLFGFLTKESTHELIQGAEVDGEGLAMLTWFVFGSAVIGHYLDYFTWEVIVYAVLSLTVIRIIPIYLSLIGSSENMRSRLFLGWFGPRGLASIVFAIIVLNTELPGAPLLALIVACTVLLSLLAHGLTAQPLARWLGKMEKK